MPVRKTLDRLRELARVPVCKPFPIVTLNRPRPHPNGILYCTKKEKYEAERTQSDEPSSYTFGTDLGRRSIVVLSGEVTQGLHSDDCRYLRCPEYDVDKAGLHRFIPCAERLRCQ